MERISERMPAGAFVGTLLLAAGLVLPHSAPRAATPTHAIGPFAIDLACGPAETPVAAGLLARIRADAAAGAPLRRRDATGARSDAGPAAARKASRPPAAARLAAPRKSPRDGQEARRNVLRSFYTCAAAAASNPAQGTGWRLVGPLLQG